MPRQVLPLLLSLFVTSSIFGGFSRTQDFRPATPEELAMKDVAFAPGVAAVILDWVEVDDDTQAVSSEYYRIKILTEDGKKYADVEVPYIANYPVNGRVAEISARTIQPDGTIVPFDGKVYDKILYKSSGMRIRAKTFSLAGVQVGSILEYRYHRRWSSELLLNTLWSIQRDIPVLRARMSIKPYDSQGEFASFFIYHQLPQGTVSVRNPNKTYDLELTNVPAYQTEELAPPEESLKMRANFYYTTGRIDPPKFWVAQVAAWNKSIENFIGRPGAVVAEAQLLRVESEPITTLRNVYAKVQTFKNLSYEEESTAGEKRNAAEVVAKREGYSAEINRAFVALARAAGLDASVVCVALRDRFFFSPDVPDAAQMDGEIAEVTIAGETYYFDPGTPTAPFAIVSWEKSAVPGYRIAKGTAQSLATFADQAPESAVMRRTADLRLNGDVLEGTVVATFTGQEALQRRVRVWGEDEAARTKDLEDEAKGWFPAGATVKLMEVTGARSHAEALVAKFDVALRNVLSAAGSRTVLPISVFASSAKNLFASATRTHPIYFHYRRREEDEVKVTLPETLSLAAVPPPEKLNIGALAYTNETKQDGTAITFKRGLTVDTTFVDAKYYHPLRNFFSTMVAADQKPLILVGR